MKLIVGKTYLLKKNDPSNPLVLETIVESYVEKYDYYRLKIFQNKKEYTGFYNPRTTEITNLLGHHMFNWSLVEKETPIQVCDCGGFKIYQSYDKHFHSHWCTSQQKGTA